ncbi:MAG: Ig-like domain-containing protein [Candidatus Acidiferrum sp.]
MPCHLLKRVLLLTLLWTPLAAAQNTISTVVGGNSPMGIATQADVITPSGVALDSQGNLYIAQGDGSQILRVTPGGVISVFAGGTYLGFGGDGGPAASALLSLPVGITLDSNQNIFIVDSGNNRIRRIDAHTGVITTVAGSATQCPGGANQACGDGGLATKASLSGPEAIAFDTAGDMFIADTLDDRIRRVDAITGNITTVAGTGAPCSTTGCGDGGAATLATLNQSSGVAVDANGDIFIADSVGIRRVDATTKIITTIATPPDDVSFLIFESSGNLLAVGLTTVYRVNPTTFATTTLAGTLGSRGDTGDGGPATSASLNIPFSVAEDPGGNLYIGQFANRVRKVDNSAQHVITTYAGGGSGGDGGPDLNAILGLPNGGTIDANGNGFIADRVNNRIRRVDGSTQVITTFAGSGEPGSSGDGGPATSATLSLSESSETGVVADSSGNIYFVDGVDAVRVVSASNGTLSRYAGGTFCNTPTKPCGDGGPAASASLSDPAGLAFDGNNNLFIGDSVDERVRRVDGSSKTITTIAGNGTVCATPTAACGDGGLATSASISPVGIASDISGNVYIADDLDNRVRRVDATTQVITTVAGNGTTCATPGTGCGDGGAATSAQLTNIETVALDSAGNLFIADQNVIRRVDATTHTIATIAGNGTAGFSGDGGPARSASLNHPYALWVDPSQTLYIADTLDNRIRRVALAPTATFSGNIANFGSLIVGATSPGQTITLTNTGSDTLSLSFVFSGAPFASTNTCASTNNALAPLQSCTFTVTFSPTSAGEFAGSLEIASNDPVTPATTFSFGGAGSATALTSITLTPANPSIVAASTQQFTATGNYSGGSTQNLTASVAWTSSNTSVATIKNSGTATGVVAGSATIRAGSGSINSSTTLTVTAPTLLGIEFAPAAAYLLPKQIQQFTATAVYSNDTQVDVTNSVVWKSSNTAVATINASGLVTGIAVGATPAAISAVLGSTSATNSSTVAVTTAGFVYTSSGLNEPRYAHSAALLPNGSVLIAGGINPASGFTSSAELYDPATETFSDTGSLNNPRYFATATTLNNGTVLIAEGNGSGTAEAPAELYHPSTGEFTLTGTPTVQSLYGSATLLANGKVLLVGGLSPSTAVPLAIAELYDPSTGQFTQTGSLNDARYLHAAVLLNSGEVLIAGGAGTNGALTSAELYNPSTGLFTTTGSLNSAAEFAEATLLNSGKVFVVGVGSIPEIYDPSTGKFTNSASGALVVGTLFGGNTAPLLSNGDLLLVGDYLGTDLYNGAILYNPANDTAANTGDLNTSRVYETTTLLNNGQVLVVGGLSLVTDTGSVLGSAELYTPGSFVPPNLTSIAVTPAAPTVQIGNSQVFTATGTFAGGGTQTLQAVNWSSSNPAVATITNRGAAFGLAAGTTTITACAGSTCGSTLLTVSSGAAPTLTSITVTPANPSVPKGNTQQFTATGNYSNGSTKNLTGSVTWGSTTTSIATITGGGLATGVATGTSTISATSGNVVGSTTLAVTSAVLVSIAITPGNPSVAKGLTEQFTAAGTYSDGSTANITGSVTWSSGTAATASITASGLATALGVGTSTIKAASGAISGSTLLTVTGPTLVSITVTPANPSIPKGTTEQFTATGTYSDSSTKNITGSVTWSSATTGVATITSGGLASGVAVGTATITATSEATATSTKLTVGPANLVSIAVTPASPSITKGTTQQFTATGTYSDSATQNITGTVTWSSATTSVATITSGGLASAVGTGTSVIKAALGAISGSTTLAVTSSSVTLESIAVTPASPSIAKGATQQFTATGTYSDSSTKNITGSVTWSSATTGVATITSGGLATGVSAGTSVIKATLGAVSGATTLTVTPAAALPTLTIAKAGKGSGTVTSQVAGITCGTGCVAQFPVGTVVVLTAVQAKGSTFTGWGGACTNAAGSCTVTLKASLSVTANFALVSPAPPAGPFAYVPVSTANVLSIFDLSTNLPVTNVDIGHAPFAAEVSPSGSAVYVSNSNDDTVAVLDPLNNTIVATIPVGPIPGGLAITPDGSRVYVSTHGSNAVSVIDAATNTAIASIPVGAYPFLLAASPDGKTIYVTNFNGASVSVISTATNTVTGTIKVGQAPQGIAISADGKTLYVACTNSNLVDVISTASNTITTTIPVPHGPLGISLSPDGTRAFVSEYSGASTAVINLASNTVVGSVVVATNPYGSAFTPDGAFVWQTNSTAKVVSIISTTTDAVVATVPVTGSAFNVGIGASAPMSETITQPLSPTSPNQFNFGPHNITVTYPPGTNFSGVNMTVVAAQANQQTFKQRVGSTAFAGATCVVYSGAGGNCVDYQITCASSGGGTISCPSVTTPTIEVKSSFDTQQSIVNPGFLTTPIGTNDWTNIFESFYLQRIDPTMKGRTRSFSEFVAVDLGASNAQGAGTLRLLDPLTATDERMFPAGTTIPVEFTLTSVGNPASPVTDATAGISVVEISNGTGNPTANIVLDAPASFTYAGGHYSYSLGTTGYAPGTYVLTIYGNAFPAQQVEFVVPAATSGAQLTTTVESLTVNKTTGQYLATIKIANSGGAAANGVTVTASALNSAATVTAMPLSLGDVAAGASTTATLAYPVSAGPDGSRGGITISESYAGGTSGVGLRVILP